MNLKIYLQTGLCAAMMLGVSQMSGAQNTVLLQEDFNTTFPPTGWTKVDSNLPGAVNHWEQYTDSRTNITSAHVSSPNYSQSEPAKEEMLITPKITLDGYYDLKFTWEGATAQSINKLPNNAEYDFQVRIRPDGSNDWTTIFSFLDEDMVRNAGVGYPWTAWTWNPSSINLTDWYGKTVEIAFVYCLLKPGPSTGNDIWLDDVSLVGSQQITGPIADLNLDSYIFPTTFIGGKKYSDTFTLKNTGRDVLNVTGVAGLDGTDFGCTIDPAAVSLKTGDTYTFQFWYAPTVSGSPRATATIRTNGGDVDVALSGTKKVVPADAVYEGFEGEGFPPLGWTAKGGWYRYGAGLSGDACAVCGFPENAELTTPRLDLSGTDPQPFQFTYFEQFEPYYDDSYGPANYFKVYLSTNGGTQWTEIFNSEEYDVNMEQSVTLELPANSGDNCYLKFSSYIPNFSMSDYDDVPDYSMVYLDDVLLPKLYGSDMAPNSSTPINPANGQKDVYHKNLELQWTGELFATNYKLYLGKSATNFDIINGMDMGTATSYVVPRLDYSTTYYWKVVAYNGNVENTAAPTWNFTVMGDQSVKELPYSENFDNGFSLGWNVVKEGATKWDLSNIQPYGGKGSTAMASGYQIGTKALLETPEILIPATGETLVSFVWGNAAPVGLTVDETGARVNNTTEPGKDCTVYFDVEVDGEWKNLAMLHEEGETKYWYRESFPMAEYAGKSVAFRWRYEVYGYSAASASVDNFLVETVSGDKAMVAFNYENWNAGYVNNDCSVTSRNPILLSNIGLETLKIRSVNFASPNFTSSLQEGTEIASNRSQSFSVTYAAGRNAGEVSDEMVVTFENGLSTSFPVSGTTLASDIRYYDFEADEHASTQPMDFTTVDVDGMATVQPVLIYYPKRGAPFAYIVLNITGPYADWRNVYPVSGEQVLAAMGEANGSVDTNDWIISPRVTATGESQFRFFAKSYGDETQVFSQNKIEVLVSETDKNLTSFVTEMPLQKIPWSGSEGKWTEYTVDLSKYAGKDIYVAVRHTADRDGFVSFFDDFWFEHFSHVQSGIEMIHEVPSMGNGELYDLNGLRVDPANAAPGIYILRGNGQTQKVIVK